MDLIYLVVAVLGTLALLFFFIRRSIYNQGIQKLQYVSMPSSLTDIGALEMESTISSDPEPPEQEVQNPEVQKEIFDETYLQQCFNKTNEIFLEETGNNDINQLVLSEISKQINCFHAALYKSDEQEELLTLAAGYGLSNRPDRCSINFGQGQLGQSVLDNEPIVLRNLPDDYIRVSSGLGETTPTWIGVFPLSFKGKAYGVLEMCFLYSESELIKNHLERVAELFGAHFFNQGVIAKQSQLQQLEQEKLRSEAILEGCADGFIGFNRHGIIDFCNRSAAELIRLEKRNILGQSVNSLLGVYIKEDSEEAFTLIHDELQQTPLTDKTEIQITDSHNEEITVLVTANTISVAGDILFTLFLQKISVDLF
ncbi:MAG: GAF domain-containing protein [Bacteroidota bacterium]